LKKFEFPLERALEVRRVRRMLAEEKLGEAQREESVVKSRLDAAYEARDSAQREIRNALRGRLDQGRLRRMLRYGDAVENEIFRQRADLKMRREITVKAREAAVLRTQEERALERHRERKLSEYMDVFWWEQAKQMDDIGAERFLRSKER
jgi:flagellar biosynthesis chaperone FliJ